MAWTSHLAGCAAALLAFGGAEAATFTATWTGTVASGANHDLFGSGGASLAGAAFSAVFILDDGVSGATLTETSDHSRLEGYGANSPVAASLTINGVTVQLGQTGGYVDALGTSAPFGNESIRMYAERDFTIVSSPFPGIIPPFTTYQLESHLTFGATTILADLTNGDFRTPVDFGLSPLSGIPGVPAFDFGHAFSGRFTIVETQLSPTLRHREVDLALRPTRLRIAATPLTPPPGPPTAPVPEPSAWALMILGFGAAGAAIRRRRRFRLAA